MLSGSVVSRPEKYRYPLLTVNYDEMAKIFKYFAWCVFQPKDNFGVVPQPAAGSCYDRGPGRTDTFWR